MIFPIAVQHGWKITVNAVAFFGNHVVECYEPSSQLHSKCHIGRRSCYCRGFIFDHCLFGLLEAASPVDDKGELCKKLWNAADVLAVPSFATVEYPH